MIESYLEKYRRMLHTVNDLGTELDALRSKSLRVVSRAYSSTGGGRGGDGRGLETQAIKIADTETNYLNALDELADLRQRVDDELALIPDNMREILTRVYIAGWTVTKTAKDLNYNYRTVERLKQKALQQIHERNGENEKY